MSISGRSDEQSANTSAPGILIPAWVDGLGMGWLLTPFLLWISAHEIYAALIGFVWLGLRAYFGTPNDRQCMGLSFLFGLIFEVALWVSGACLYATPGVIGTPLWILALWCLGGLILTRFTAPSGWTQPEGFRRSLALIPFAMNCLLPSSWLSSMGVVILALLAAALLWREKGEAPHWSRSLRVLLVGIGGTSASWSFGLAGVCIFPQAVYGIPPWALSLWTSLVIVLLAFRRR